MTSEQQQEVRRWSYRVPPPSDECASGEGLIAPGDVAYVRYGHGPFAAGTCVRVNRYVNAGFNGIEALVTVTTPYGEHAVREASSHISAGNLVAVHPALAAAVADGRIVQTEDDYGTVCYAPAQGDGVVAEIFRLWVEYRDVVRPARYFITNAGNDFAIVFASDTHVEGAITALMTAQATWGTARWPFGGRNVIGPAADCWIED